MSSVSRIALVLAMFLTITSTVFSQNTKQKYTVIQTDADGTEWSVDLNNLYYTGTIIAPVMAVTPPRLGIGFILEMDCSDGTARILRTFVYDALTEKQETDTEVKGWYRAEGVTLKLMVRVCKMDKSKMKKFNTFKEGLPNGQISFKPYPHTFTRNHTN